ncbi:MAG: hypothetical protein GY898_33425 [Proteobacteria bacterium]|nr:hypothetical protein [Pseudomonadota bacterium]
MIRAAACSLVVLLLAAGPGLAADAPDAASFDALGGGHDRGDVTLALQGGWPRLSLRGQVGAGARLAPVLEIEATPSWRIEPSLGVGISLLRRPEGRLSTEVLLGWHAQHGALAQRGPSAVARVRVMGTARRIGFWLAIGTRHTLLFDRTTVRRSSGEEVSWSARHRWSPHLAGGFVWAVHRNVGVEVGLDWTFVDVEVVAISLPGIHVGLQFGGGPR